MATVVILQISGANDKWIPAGVPLGRDETQTESYKRRLSPSTGSAVVNVSDAGEISVAELADQLHDAGYHVMNVFRQERVDRKRRGKKYHMLRYVMMPGDEALDSLENIRDNYETVEEDLIDLLNDSYWRQVRVYENHQENGDVMLTINLGVRVPRFRPDGEPVMVYPRNEAGQKTGPAAPVEPKSQLSMKNNGQLVLV